MRILILGCGRAGSGLAREMIVRGHEVSVVDKDPQSFKRLGAGFKGKTVVGIAFDQQALLQAGIERADGLAAVTVSDEANVVAALIGRDIYHVPRVVARLYDPTQAEIYKRMGIQTIAPIAWGVQRIADLLIYSQLEPVFHVSSGDVDFVESEVPPILVGRSVNDLTVPGEIHIVAITRGGHTFLPSLATRFVERDTIHLAVLTSSIQRLKELLGA
jgi:trk system potassium uptake protein TrkA